jgi:hypothetical protein
MKRFLIKTLIATTILSGFAITGWAAEMTSKVNGRARATLVQESLKDGASTVDMDADGRLGYEMNKTEGDWTGTAYLQVNLSSDGTLFLRDANIILENPTLAVMVGRQYPWGVTVGNKYLTDTIGDIYWAGEYATKNGWDSFLKIGLKDVGLSFVLGMNPQTDGAADLTPAVDDVYNETVAAVIFSTSMIALTVNASYISVTGAVDEKAAGAATKDSAVDGYAQSSIAVGVGYSISEIMAVSLNIDMLTTKAGGSPAPDEAKDQYMALIFDLGLSETSGVTMAYNTYNQDDGTDNPLANTAIVAGYNTVVAGTGIYVQFFSETSKDDDTALDSATSKVGAGMTYNF